MYGAANMTLSDKAQQQLNWLKQPRSGRIVVTT